MQSKVKFLAPKLVRTFFLWGVYDQCMDQNQVYEFKLFIYWGTM